MKYYDAMDKEEKGTFITFDDQEQAEGWLDKQEDRFFKNSIRFGMHIVEDERLTSFERNNKAFEIANNIIYFNDNSDYLSALYEICIMLNPNIQENKIGTEFIEE